MMYGIDLLGLAKAADNVIDAIPADMAVGWLDIIFGDTTKKRERVLAKKRPAIRVHLTDGTGQRNHNAEPGVPGEKDYPAYIKGAQAYEALKKKYPSTVFYISPRLEHDCKDHAVVNKWFEIIKTYAPSCIPISSAFTGWTPPGIDIEHHGNNAKGDITSNDGESLSDAPQDYKNSGTFITFSWLHTFNGRGSGDDGFTPPSKRPAKAFADIHDIRYCVRWLTGIPADSAIKAPEILKPYSEYYSLKDDWRERKICYLSKVRVSGWDICNRAGKKVSSLKYYPGTNNGLYRYYCNDYCDELYDKLGGATGLLKGGGKSILFNCIYRQGKMR